MSDALTDISRDIERIMLMEKAMEVLMEYLSNPTEHLKYKLLDLLKQVDSVEGGFWTVRNDFSTFIAENLTKLVKGDKDTWLTFLIRANGFKKYDKLKKLSPFKDKVVMLVDYGYSSVRFEGELTMKMEEILKKRGYSTYNGEKYVMILPEDAFDKAEIIQI